MTIINIPVRHLDTQIQVVEQYNEIESPKIFMNMEEQLCYYLGYKVKVWEILTGPRNEKERFCKKKIYESIANKALKREERKNLSFKKSRYEK